MNSEARKRAQERLAEEGRRLASERVPMAPAPEPSGWAGLSETERDALLHAMCTARLHATGDHDSKGACIVGDDPPYAAVEQIKADLAARLAVAEEEAATLRAQRDAALALADDWQGIYDRWAGVNDGPRVAIFRVHARKLRDVFGGAPC